MLYSHVARARHDAESANYGLQWFFDQIKLVLPKVGGYLVLLAFIETAAW